MLSPGKYHSEIPKDRRDNLLWRQAVGVAPHEVDRVDADRGVVAVDLVGEIQLAGKVAHGLRYGREGD